ncbi:MAG: PUA domain-containing protein [Candidatus Woesearchaeota archaeon]
MRYLSNKEIRSLKNILEKYGISEDRLFEKEGIIFDNRKKPVLFNYEGNYYPTLYCDLSSLKKVVVDMNAVKFIASGADIMRPGIKHLDDFNKDEIVKVVDEKNNVALAIGNALFSSEEIKAMEKGKVIKNLHYVGDKIYKS